jgi:hypothetical protein
LGMPDPSPPVFLRKDFILEELHRDNVQGCDSKRFMRRSFLAVLILKELEELRRGRYPTFT